ncbi:uncharacterized protein LOC121265805 [Juglans microcarpa x Juglans regia]|uniref:uncharacterized protein LOC121265805 n=1 Tax=Juglans microcarpa x Juglans regia TaxID=2249226 RepID=UPI001B7F2FA8|nr:uncharacterized protein LOC121265805 [Juglans microcarpa x Juglans regia]
MAARHRVRNLGVLNAGNEEDICTTEQFNQMHPPTFDAPLLLHPSISDSFPLSSTHAAAASPLLLHFMSFFVLLCFSLSCRLQCSFFLSILFSDLPLYKSANATTHSSIFGCRELQLFFGVFGACRECIFCHRLLPLDFRWGLVTYFLLQVKNDELFSCWGESVPGGNPKTS